MTTSNRPLSPHIQVYRWPINMTTSILHRASGMALAAGTLLLVWWIVAIVRGPESFALVQNVIGSVIGRLLLLGWTWSLFFHLLNGVRHLVWDVGAGFEVRTASRYAWFVIVGSVVLTLVTWGFGLAVMGAHS